MPSVEDDPLTVSNTLLLVVVGSSLAAHAAMDSHTAIQLLRMCTMLIGEGESGKSMGLCVATIGMCRLARVVTWESCD